jgi:uncharacterized protein (UPF0276 family)
LTRVASRYPLSFHGLTLSLAGRDPPDGNFLAQLRDEIARYAVPFHSDHLCVSRSGARVAHDLLPTRLCRDSALRTADRLVELEHTLGVPLAVENISYYVHPGVAQLNEAEFITTVLEHCNAGLLFDVNNAFVNSVNHGFDPRRLIRDLPGERVVELHVAGHSAGAAGLLIDTHSKPVCDEVLALLGFTLRQWGARPVLLEWDDDVPPFNELQAELGRVRNCYEAATAESALQRDGREQRQSVRLGRPRSQRVVECRVRFRVSCT